MTPKQESNPLVLAVDDDATMRLLLRTALEQVDFEVVEAADGVGALEMFKANHPDVVLLDVEMPNGNGFDVCEKIRALPEGRHTPILMVTGLDDVESIERAFTAGATDFVGKPINWAILGHHVRYMLKGGRMLARLRESESMLARAQSIARLGNWRWDFNGDRIVCSQQGYQILDHEAAEPGSFSDVVLDRVHADDRGALERCVTRSIRDDAGFAMVFRVCRRDGAERVIQTEGGPEHDSEGRIMGLMGTVQDITRRKAADDALRASQQTLQTVMSGAPMILFATDRDGIVTLVDGASTGLLTASCGDLVGQNAFEVFRKWPDITENICLALVGQTPTADVQWQDTVFETRYNAMRDSDGQVMGVIALWFDVTERVRADEQIRYLAQYDSLTGLPNRSLFRDRLAQALTKADRSRRLLGLMLVDLDRFKNINDSLGHHVGDQLLVAVVDRLQGCVRRSDTIARRDGDEFAIILEDLADENAGTAMARKILSAFRDPFIVDDRELFVTGSIGAVIYPFDNGSTENLISNAGSAVCHAKQLGRDRYHFYTDAMNVRAYERLEMEIALRRALSRDEFELNYQPQLDLESGAITGVEALIRWIHPEMGRVSPGDFIPLLEESGLIVPVGRWILRTACAQAMEWQNLGLPPVRVAVNLSARQFIDKRLKETVIDALEASGLEAQYLDLEITESLLMQNTALAAKTLQELHEVGVKISIDDFGTGYSSLAYLKGFPVDTLKVDQSFIRNICHDSDNKAITTAIIMMAHSLRLSVIAEGVEDRMQLAFLRNRNCDEMQGYFFSPAVAPAKIVEMLSERRNLFATSRPGLRTA